MKAEKDCQATSLQGKQYLIFGGTEGIGLATAKKLASMGGSVHLIARNLEKGINAVKLLSLQSVDGNSAAEPTENSTANASDKSVSISVSPFQTISFTSLDTTDIESLNSFCVQEADRLKSKGLDGILMCAGGLNYGPRRTTATGLEMTFAQNYFSRFLILYRLSDCLGIRRGRAIHCLGAGNGGPVDTKDWQLEKVGFTWKPFFLSCAEQYASMGDLMVDQFNKRFQNVRFFHVFPGVVDTNSAANQNFPKLITMFSSLFLPWIAKTPESAANVMVDLLVSPKYDTSPNTECLIGPEGQFIPLKSSFGNGTVGTSLWDYSVGLLDSSLKK
jgi:NAD(P)-dependent dehydrogenase (short-subunit alcohol dehydrogenase family)